jgi:predicted FMN-binding regulatory protein PaiB
MYNPPLFREQDRAILSEFIRNTRLATLVSNGPDGLRGIFHVPIPGTRKPSRIEENAGGAAIVLKDREIGALNQPAQAVRGDRGRQI